MKVAFVKQILDVFGPWATVLWKDTTSTALFDVWPGKATYWEMTCLLQADWYVIEQKRNTNYIRDAVLKDPANERLIRDNSQHVVREADVPFSDYDVVISIDPILDAAERPGTLMVYYMQEHWDSLYRVSLRRPERGYDLFLAHMMDGPARLRSLPQALSFPYLRSPDTVRSVFSDPPEEEVWADWRTLTGLTASDAWSDDAEAAADRLEQVLGLPVRYKGDFGRVRYGLSNPPAWGDAKQYLREMGRCRYYLSLGRWITGAGQALCDAASLGCLCIGEADKAFHRMICHPHCLCADLSELPQRMRALAASPELQREVRQRQDEALRKKFVEVPLRDLEQAAALKRKRK